MPKKTETQRVSRLFSCLIRIIRHYPPFSRCQEGRRGTPFEVWKFWHVTPSRNFYFKIFHFSDLAVLSSGQPLILCYTTYLSIRALRFHSKQRKRLLELLDLQTKLLISDKMCRVLRVNVGKNWSLCRFNYLIYCSLNILWNICRYILYT